LQGAVGIRFADTFDHFFNAYQRFLNWLELTNQHLAEHASSNDASAPRLGSRLAVHAGRYRYGKIGLAASMVPAFDGAAIIDVSRLEQGLRAHAKRNDDPLPGGHHVIVSTAAKQQLTSLESPYLQHIDDRAVTSKEAEQPASIYLVSL
jgi:hypothetical protein